MKLIYSGLIALSLLANAFAAIEIQEGHNYHVADGQLVDDGPKTPTPSPTPSPTPLTVIVNNNISQTVQAPPAPAPAPVPEVLVVRENTPAPETPVSHDYDFIMNIWKAFNNHDVETITSFIPEGQCNYFGRTRASLRSIVYDMNSDANRYGQWHTTYYPGTFYREVSNEYSPRWQGPMIYDNISVYSEVYENGVRWHRANVRFTVGYTFFNNVITIYALVYKVI